MKHSINAIKHSLSYAVIVVFFLPKVVHMSDALQVDFHNFLLILLPFAGLLQGFPAHHIDNNIIANSSIGVHN